MKSVPQHTVTSKDIEALIKNGGAASTVLFLAFFRQALKGGQRLYAERLGISAAILGKWERAYGRIEDSVPTDMIVEHCFTSIDLLQNRLSAALSTNDNQMKVELLSGLFYLQQIGEHLELTEESSDAIFKKYAIGLIGKAVASLKSRLTGPQITRARNIGTRPIRRSENVRIGRAAARIGVKFETLHSLVRINGIPLEMAEELCEQRIRTRNR